MHNHSQLPDSIITVSLNLSTDGIVIFEPVLDADDSLADLRIELLNETAVRIFDLPRVAAEGQLFSMLWNIAPGDPCFTNAAAVLTRGEEIQYEWLMEKAGGMRWFDVSLRPFGAHGIAALYHETTEKRRHIAELEHERQQLEAIMQSSPHAILVFEALRNSEGLVTDFRVARFNRNALDATHMGADQLRKTTLFKCMPAVQPRLDKYLAVIETQVAETYDFYNEKLGVWRRITNAPLGDGFVMTMENITEQKQQSARIEEQASIFNGILKSVQNGLTVFQIIRNSAGELEDLEYCQVADTVLRDTGFSREQMIGSRIRTLFPDIVQTDYWTAYLAAVRLGSPVSFETHFTLPGYDNYLINWVTPIGKDKLVSIYYIINDLKRAQQKLEQSISELRRSNEDLEQFASIASHDLQEPLRKVESFSTMLETRYAEALGDGGRDLLRRMQSAAGRMRNLVSGLLALARLSGDEHLPLQPVDPGTLMADIISELDDTIKATGGVVNIPARLPFVQGLEGQLRHLFHNLLTNALKFHEEGRGPVVTISCGPAGAADADRLLPHAQADHYVRIVISDNGIGFEPQFAEKIFGLFERLHGIGSYKGTGLGLSICRRVAERHEGAIWAESLPGQGATFIVLLKQA